MLPEYARFYGHIGEQQRFNHEECGDTRGRLYVLYTGQGWKYHCHNCYPKAGSSGFYRDYVRFSPPLKTLRLRQNAENNSDISRKILELPSDFRELELNERGWLYKYGITDDEIEEQNIGYSDYYSRIVLPTYNEGNLLSNIQLRATTKLQTPKYINMSIKGEKPLHQINKHNSSHVILCEDILSAIKIGRVNDSAALLGSSVNIGTIMKLKRPCILWLDYDKKDESLQLCKRFSALIGSQVKNIVTRLDPKEYSTQEIIEIIKRNKER